MPRVGRIVVPGVPHHITQRGNGRQDVFFSDDDRRVYLSLLTEYGARFGLGIVGYCLMSNHVHLVGIPAKADSLAKAVGRTHFRYTQYQHDTAGGSGHLWQNRFFSCSLDEPHCWAALRYLERNPVRAGLAGQPWDYPWSSASAHCLGWVDNRLDSTLWQKAWAPDRWRQWIGVEDDSEQLHHLRAHTHTGWPLGGDTFLAWLESLTGRRMRPLPEGRPRKHRRRTETGDCP